MRFFFFQLCYCRTVTAATMQKKKKRSRSSKSKKTAVGHTVCDMPYTQGTVKMQESYMKHENWISFCVFALFQRRSRHSFYFSLIVMLLMLLYCRRRRRRFLSRVLLPSSHFFSLSLTLPYFYLVSFVFYYLPKNEINSPRENVKYMHIAASKTLYGCCLTPFFACCFFLLFRSECCCVERHG